MNRRNFIRATIAKLISITLLGSSQHALATVTNKPESDAQQKFNLGQLFTDIESAKTVGRKYLREEVNNANNLLACTGLLNADMGQKTDLSELRKAFANQRKLDFIQGNTVILDGYVLARSEVSLCALLVILDDTIY